MRDFHFHLLIYDKLTVVLNCFPRKILKSIVNHKSFWLIHYANIHPLICQILLQPMQLVSLNFLRLYTLH